MTFGDLLAAILFLFAFLLVVGAFIWPLSGDSFFSSIEKFGASLAKRKSWAIISIAGVAILMRVALLPVVPVPIPQFHDEFSYLLAADTFAHGRLANPPHPLCIYFDTIHVNQQPSYISKYPPAQGFALALGQLLGHPWIGVLLSVSAMTAAIVWALQAWLSPPWALLGGMLAFLRLGLFGYWVNSYWGGAMAALGGALVIGALPRVVHSCRPRHAIILALGEAILANSRPFEGLIFSLPVFAFLLLHFFWQSAFSFSLMRRFFIPFGTAMLLWGLFLGYYNWRGTGHPLLFPYTLNDRIYQPDTPPLLWQKPATLIHYANPQFEAFYNGWNRDTWLQGRPDSIGRAIRIAFRDVGRFVRFFLWPELCIPLLAIGAVFRDRRVRLLVIQFVVCFAGFLLVAWFIPHYAAPLLPTALVLLVQAMRHLRKWRFGNRPVGVALSRAVVLLAIILAPFHQMDFPKPGLTARARIATELSRVPGKQLVVVHYSPQHYVHAEWVYNRADIDNAKIVWAREIPGVDLSPLLSYFKDRRVWIVDADSPLPEPRSYLPQSHP